MTNKLISIKLTLREITTLELAFSMANEPPYPPNIDAEHIETIGEKLSNAAYLARKKAQ